VFVPVDVVKERMQIQSDALVSARQVMKTNTFMPYKNSFDALVRILKDEGLAGVYKGYTATVLSYGPFSAFYFMLYEEVTDCLTPRGQIRRNALNSLSQEA
jgi:hypothetical protein